MSGGTTRKRLKGGLFPGDIQSYCVQLQLGLRVSVLRPRPRPHPLHMGFGVWGNETLPKLRM